MIGKRSAPPPTGLPGEQREARLRRSRLQKAVLAGVVAVLGWAALVLVIGPSRPNLERPALGPARRDIVAVRAFDDQQEVPDLAAKLDRAAAQVPIHYALDAAAVSRRISGLHEAFRLVRPRYRLSVADSARTEEVRAGVAVSGGKAAKLRPVPPAAAAEPSAKAVSDEMARLRPEFEALVAVRHGELSPEVFAALQAAGFSEEIELLLADVAQVLLSQRIVRDLDRFDDDLGRGVLDVTTRAHFDRAGRRPDVVSLDNALQRSDEYVAEFARQKKPSRLDEPVLQSAVRALARSMVDTTYTRDLAATRRAEEEARAAVAKTRSVHVAKGQALVKRGELVTTEVQASIERMWRGIDPEPSWQSYAATALLLAVALALFVAFARRHLHHFRHRPRDAALLGAILLVHALVLRGMIALLPFLAEAGAPIAADLGLVVLPHALGPALATLFLRPFTAAPFALLCAIVATLMVHNAPLSPEAEPLAALVPVLSLVVALAGVHAARRFRQRSDLAAGTLLISGVSALTGMAAGLLAAPAYFSVLDTRTGWLAALGAGSGVVTYMLLAALTPLFESVFNRLTDIKLVELASMNHPALRLLATDAPGTFTHSVMVGNLAQAGADAIGANGLLARVGAYYHDLGKTRAAKYYAENQAGDNPHDRLKPHLSALIIKSHVKDGIKILQEYGLPDEIIDFVPQHHGTSLIAHFYHRAQRDAEGGADEVHEADFRYPGPKPQRKETALLMLADAVEAAAKALPDPNAVRIQALVKRIIAGKTEDGQFDECDLTLRELAMVEAAFVKTLVGIHHVRPVYLPAVTPQREPTATVVTTQPVPPLALPDDLRQVALLVDGGVGVPPPSPAKPTLAVVPQPPDPAEDGPPVAPTAVVAHTQSPAPSQIRRG